MPVTAEYLIKKFNLIKHPEGGYYSEVYRSEELIEKGHLPNRYTGQRSFSTLIYFLLDGDDFSAFHRVNSDEIWHFYAGTSLTLYIIGDNGILENIVLSNDPEDNGSYFAIIKRGSWFAAKTNKVNSFTLVGCTVAPGFDFEDFELADRQKLIKSYPQHEDLIINLT
ncbi:MAG: cupin domain-containing protein [Bacteroidales bacterium]|nr:cupin domain-containing protein [Bacteroidales bacterium]